MIPIKLNLVGVPVRHWPDPRQMTAEQRKKMIVDQIQAACQKFVGLPVIEETFQGLKTEVTMIVDDLVAWGFILNEPQVFVNGNGVLIKPDPEVGP